MKKNRKKRLKSNLSDRKSQPASMSKQLDEEEPVNPSLRFTPYAWAKLQWFCHYGETEIGGFGVTAADAPLLVEDFVTVKQAVSCVSVSFDDEAVADFFDAQVDAGRRPEQFARTWCHSV